MSPTMLHKVADLHIIKPMSCESSCMDVASPSAMKIYLKM